MCEFFHTLHNFKNVGLLTVVNPFGISRQFAVYYDVSLEILLPVANGSSNHHPPNISGAGSIVPVHEEVTIGPWISNDGKEVLWLGFDVRPGALNQSRE